MRFTSLLTALLALAIVSPAQVTITSQGFATTPGAAFPPTPVSPPVLFAPTVHLGEVSTQPVEADSASNGVVPSASGETRAKIQPMATEPQPFNFGAAQFGRGQAQGGVGQNIDGKSLGEVARDLKHSSSMNARTFTNNDINSLKSGGISGAATASSVKQDNWTPDNGVINPEGQPNAVGAPQQPQAAPQSPFAPRSQNHVQSPNSPQSANEKPSAQRPYEMAQTGQPPIEQGEASAASSQSSAGQNQPQDNAASGELPRTSSRLPLVGVLGLVTVCAGFFVRYQRDKAR
jgi:hypothetical protein